MGDCVPESLLPSLSDFLNQVSFSVFLGFFIGAIIPYGKRNNLAIFFFRNNAIVLLLVEEEKCS